MHARLCRADLVRPLGKVAKVVGLALEATGVTAPVGELCRIRSRHGSLSAEVVGFRDGRLLLMPLGDLAGVEPGGEVLALGRPATVPVGPGLVGRVIDGLGRPIDERGPLVAEGERSIAEHAPPSALGRRRIAEPLETGIRAIDAVLPIGRGQRVGIFAGSGVGKSVLLGSLAGHAAADVNVIALVGERGREVREFVERDLGPAGLARSVVVVATADEPPLVRRQAAFAATAVAEFFRDAGRTVLFMMDSLTRLAMAQREIGLAVGEPPATRGYPPSVFALLPRLLERAGTSAHRGDITGLYTVLVEGDDLNDPVADASRAHPRRAHRALARAGERQSLPRHRRARERQPARGRSAHARRVRRRRRPCAITWRRTAPPATSWPSARTWRAAIRASIARSAPSMR